MISGRSPALRPARPTASVGTAVRTARNSSVRSGLSQPLVLGPSVDSGCRQRRDRHGFPARRKPRCFIVSALRAPRLPRQSLWPRVLRMINVRPVCPGTVLGGTRTPGRGGRSGCSKRLFTKAVQLASPGQLNTTENRAARILDKRTARAFRCANRGKARALSARAFEWIRWSVAQWSRWFVEKIVSVAATSDQTARTMQAPPAVHGHASPGACPLPRRPQACRTVM